MDGDRTLKKSAGAQDSGNVSSNSSTESNSRRFAGSDRLSYASWTCKTSMQLSIAQCVSIKRTVRHDLVAVWMGAAEI